MGARPRVTVLLPVYNGERHLGAAIESVLGQTFGDFELLVVDGGSSDASARIASAVPDQRLRVEILSHLGLVGALNRGLDLARGDYVVRMDHDDVAAPERLAAQVRFMHGRAGVGISGTWVRARLPDGGTERRSFPAHPAEIRCALLFEPPLAASSVILRREALERYDLRYDARYPQVEDWDLWRRAARCFPLANLPRALVTVRAREEPPDARRAAERREMVRWIQGEQLERLGLARHPLRPVHEAVSLPTLDCDRRGESFVRDVAAWFNVLRSANRLRRLYEPRVLDRFLAGRMFLVLERNPQLGVRALRLLRQTGWLRRARWGPLTRLALEASWGSLRGRTS